MPHVAWYFKKHSEVLWIKCHKVHTCKKVEVIDNRIDLAISAVYVNVDDQRKTDRDVKDDD